jgi:phosphate transport system ATP-binding protein
VSQPADGGAAAKSAVPGLSITGLHVSYGGREVLHDVNLTIPPGRVTAILGPSGCGKTTLLRCLNRLSDMTKGCNVRGTILLEGRDIRRLDPILLRQKVGMVFQKPNPFPMSVKENVLYGVKAGGLKVDRSAVVKSSLVWAGLWDELDGKVGENAWNLSVGQQQRLCIARSLAVSPAILLMDEPTGSLDPLSAEKVESTIVSLRGQTTVVIVTHNLRQAERIADYTAFIYLGQLVEFGETSQILRNPQREETRAYVAGRFG